MPNYCTPKLEFSIDPLSDTTPAWTDVTSYLIEADWNSGKSKDLDDPQAGGATFRLKNTHRDWEPEYTAGRFYPNILPLRRFRWSIVADGVSYPQGVYYTQSWNVTYPAGTTYSETVVQCVDGFGVLSLLALPALDPPTAESYEDVVAFDQPFAYYPLDETLGKKVTAAVGPEGGYKGDVTHGTSSPILGHGGVAATFGPSGMAKMHLDDTSVWHDTGQVSCECVITRNVTTNRQIVMGPWDTGVADPSFGIGVGAPYICWVYTGGTGILSVNWSGGGVGVGAAHHLAMTFDGNTLKLYKDGVLDASGTTGDSNIVNPDVDEYLYIARNDHVGTVNTTEIIGHVAFYDYALSADRVAVHADAALSNGYAQTTAGSRIAALAANPIWSTAGIPAGQITVAPRMQTGQTTLDEITTTVKAETPIGLFYFDDSGNPDYQPWDYPTTVMATLGDLQSETSYSDLALVYDDELFNQSTVSREGGLAKTKLDSSSLAAYGSRTHDENGLILSLDSDASLIAQTIVDRYANPMFRIESVSLNGAQQSARTHILSREIGDTIRVKRRGEGGTAIDVSTRILGKSKHLDTSRHLTCTWNLARGFSAADAHWRLGQVGYSELGQTTVLA